MEKEKIVIASYGSIDICNSCGKTYTSGVSGWIGEDNLNLCYDCILGNYEITEKELSLVLNYKLLDDLNSIKNSISNSNEEVLNMFKLFTDLYQNKDIEVDDSYVEFSKSYRKAQEEITDGYSLIKKLIEENQIITENE